MRVETRDVAPGELRNTVKTALEKEGHRLGLMSSIDGNQIVTLILDNSTGKAELLESRFDQSELGKESGPSYPAVSLTVTQAHWFERTLKDLFGITPEGHPRLRSVFVEGAVPLAPLAVEERTARPDFSFMQVRGEGVWELPVGPVHAGIIEPGHFRLSCLGEIVENLELRFGFLHRGVEKRLTEVPWSKARFLAEAAASDTSAGNALASALALESLAETVVPARGEALRRIALEIERAAMHIGDVGGMAVDVGFQGAASSFSILRGKALRLAELLSGSRYLRGYICPGGVTRDPSEFLSDIANGAGQLKAELEYLAGLFVDSSAVVERITGIGVVSRSLALDFGLVGVGARASGVAYDVRSGSPGGEDFDIVVESAGDVLARTRVRAREALASLAFVETAIGSLPPGEFRSSITEGSLAPSSVGLGIVEAFRGELIHLVFTDDGGAVRRYVIKDPSVNNWTAMAIAARNYLIGDFPICNKSFSLSYSGHDL
ncbi:MAG: NADH-quinone oxidoreductase subunit C [Cyanobacteria bacterium HKST-UBA02]|nr:NADH-quinone oxidoreductase subunit C [Cyanobacteria bacterium HKST-UBA02]